MAGTAKPNPCQRCSHCWPWLGASLPTHTCCLACCTYAQRSQSRTGQSPLAAAFVPCDRWVCKMSATTGMHTSDLLSSPGPEHAAHRCSDADHGCRCPQSWARPHCWPGSPWAATPPAGSHRRTGPRLRPPARRRSPWGPALATAPLETCSVGPGGCVTRACWHSGCCAQKLHARR